MSSTDILHTIGFFLISSLGVVIDQGREVGPPWKRGELHIFVTYIISFLIVGGVMGAALTVMKYLP